MKVHNQNFDSLGERYGLGIIPGASSFLVLPNNISRSSAVGAILNREVACIDVGGIFDWDGNVWDREGVWDRGLGGRRGVLRLVGNILISCWRLAGMRSC